MKILLDEPINGRLARELPEFEIKTVNAMRWKGYENGDLLSRAQDHFDVFITVDKNIRHQQNLRQYNLAIIVFDTVQITLPHLLPLVPQLREALHTIEKHEIVILQ